MSQADRYDYDAVVIGAGPAGISAAIRLRWLKTYHALPASVALVDPEPPGGLAAMGGCVLTGPSFALDAEGILEPLLSDLEALRIPRIGQRAVDLARDGELLQVRLQNRQTLRCHAVIIASSVRALHGEARYFRNGVHTTYKGYGFFPALFRAAAEDAGGQGLAVLGNAATIDLLPMLPPVAETAGGIHLILQPPADLSKVLPDRVTAVVGRSVGHAGNHRIEGVVLRRQAEESTLPCGAVLVDYHAFQRRPEHSLDGGPVQPARDRRGFVEVDARMGTAEAGVFAAGDITGRYASTAMALGDGVCAGFSAYEYVYGRKFGRSPSLFAYAARRPPDATDLAAVPFPLPARATLIALGSDADLEAAFSGLESKATRAAALARKRVEVLGFRESLSLDAVHADEALFEAMRHRALTLHHVADPGDEAGSR